MGGRAFSHPVSNHSLAVKLRQDSLAGQEAPSAAGAANSGVTTTHQQACQAQTTQVQGSHSKEPKALLERWDLQQIKWNKAMAVVKKKKKPTRRGEPRISSQQSVAPGKKEIRQAARAALPRAKPVPSWARSSFSSAPRAWREGAWAELGLREGHAEVFVRDQEREKIVSAKSSIFQATTVPQHPAAGHRKSIMWENISEEFELSDDCAKDTLLLSGRRSCSVTSTLPCGLFDIF